MRIASAEVIPYALPFREPYVTARGRLERREMVLLRLRDEEGQVGLGEAVPLSLRGGGTLERVVAELEELAEMSQFPPDSGRNCDIKGVVRSAPARCAVATALLDLEERAGAGRGQTSGEPQAVRCNATLVAGEPGAVAEDALRWAAEGYGTFKLKLGTGEDVAQVAAVREALGPEARIRVDANAAWDLETAKRIVAELEPFGVQLVEQPVATIEEAAELSRVSPIPLAGDESIETAESAAAAAESGAFRLTGVKLSKVGGPRAAREIASRLPAYVSSALDGPVGIAIAARVAAEIEDTPWPASGERAHGLATQRLFAETIASTECALRDGMLHPPPGPGLGVEIDEDALDAHRL
jgi:o-succinylbenzoate synthase